MSFGQARTQPAALPSRSDLVRFDRTYTRKAGALAPNQDFKTQRGRIGVVTHGLADGPVVLWRDGSEGTLDKNEEVQIPVQPPAVPA